MAVCVPPPQVGRGVVVVVSVVLVMVVVVSFGGVDKGVGTAK